MAKNQDYSKRIAASFTGCVYLHETDKEQQMMIHIAVKFMECYPVVSPDRDH